MKVPFLDLNAGMQPIREQIDAAVTAVFDKCDFVLGEAVGKLEREFASYCGAPHAIAVASGTDALKIALRALGVGPGRGVITSPLTFIATAEAIHSLGARPVFRDISPASYNIAPEEVARLIAEECESGPDGLMHKPTGVKITGLLPVHIFGQCADMQNILRIANEYNLFVLEDACQAFGASYKLNGENKKAGVMGIASAFSFYPSKNLGGAGDGGMIVTTDAGLAQQCRTLRIHGATRAYEHDEAGFNSRLDTIQAAVLSVKLPHTDNWIRGRRQRAAAYTRLFTKAAKKHDLQILSSADIKTADPIPEKTIILPSESENCHHSYNVFSIRVRDRDGLVAFLRSNDIGTHIYYPIPLHLQKVYSSLGHNPGDMPVSEAVCATVMAIPVYPELTEEQQKRVVEKIAEFLKG